LLRADELVEPQPVDWPLLSVNISRVPATRTRVGYSFNKVADSPGIRPTMRLSFTRRRKLSSTICFASCPLTAPGLSIDLVHVGSRWIVHISHSQQSRSSYNLLARRRVLEYRGLWLIVLSRSHCRRAVCVTLDAYDQAHHYNCDVVATNATSLFRIINHIRHVDIVSVISLVMFQHTLVAVFDHSSSKVVNLPVVHVRVMRFPAYDSTLQYGYRLPSEGVQLSLDNYCLFGNLIINTSAWKIMNTSTEQYSYSTFCKRSQLRHVMATEFVCLFFH